MPLPLSLHPSSSLGVQADPLSKVIEQIFQERGHVRDVTEESLTAEINTVEDEEDAMSISSDDDVEHQPQDAESRIKEVQAARLEMLQLVGQANNDALTALDFISLLLSKDAPRQAETSMSPALKSMTPAGTLGYDRTDASKPSKADAELDEKVALGFNFESLNSTADKLLGSATRLEKEIQRETKYWEQILTVSEKGWNLCRIPGQRHTVGVRFGFSEASPQFQARSLAALRPDKSGGLFLDQATSSEPKGIRVRILDGEKVLETSQMLPLMSGEDIELGVLVHQARDSLYDEELFFELTRDARSLFSDGVRTKNGEIWVPLSRDSKPDAVDSTQGGRSMVIDLIARTHSATNGGWTADSIALALRVLLTHAHRQKYRIRSEPPPPMSLESTPVQTLNLLQPFLNHVDHCARTNEMHVRLLSLCQIMRSAGLECDVEMHQNFGTHMSNMGEKLSSSDEATTDITAMENVVALISGTLSATFEFKLPSHSQISIKVTTNLSPPILGTSYSLKSESSLPRNPDEEDLLDFSDLPEIMQHVTKLLREAVVMYISENSADWKVDPPVLKLRPSKPGSTKGLTVMLSNERLAVVTHEAGPEAKSMGSAVIAGAWDDKTHQKQQTLIAVCAAAA